MSSENTKNLIQTAKQGKGISDSQIKSYYVYVGSFLGI